MHDVCFCTKFHHKVTYNVFTKRYSDLFGRIPDSINFISSLCGFKGIINWLTDPKLQLNVENYKETLLVLTNPQNRSVFINKINKDDLFYYLEFKDFYQISINNFKIIKSSEIIQKLQSMNPGILIKTSKPIRNFDDPFRVESIYNSLNQFAKEA